MRRSYIGLMLFALFTIGVLGVQAEPLSTKQALPEPRFLNAAGCVPTIERNSHETIIPPDWETFAPPAKGATYCDPVFGTEIKRLSDSELSQLTNSEISYFNIDDSYFILVDTHDTYLMDGETGERVKKLGTGGIRPWWMRWPRAGYYTMDGQTHNFDPATHFYKYEGNEVRLYSIETLEYIVLHKFNEYTEIDAAGGEGDVSNDGRYWLFSATKPGGDMVLFAYDLLDDVKGPETPFEIGDVGGKGSGVDYATISPSGKYVVIAWDAGMDDPFNGHFGVEVFSREDWSYLRRVHPIRIHFDLGYDSFGYEVLYATAGNNPTELATFGIEGLTLGDVVSVRLDDGFGRMLLPLPSYAHQATGVANKQSKWVFLAWEQRSEDPYQTWYPYWGEVVAVATDGSQDVVRFLHHRSRKVGDQIQKAYQPDFFPNNAGNKIVFQSTYGVGGTDTYMFDFIWNQEETTFVDVPKTHWAWGYIERLYQDGYTKGCQTEPALYYCPDTDLIRYDSSVYMVRGNSGADVEPPQPSTQIFADVPLDHWAVEWATQMYDDGLTSGCNADPLEFCGDAPHTRVEAAVFGLRIKFGAAYEPPDPQYIFADMSVSDWGLRWAEAAYNEGILPACSEDPLAFCPDEIVDRSWAAYIVVNAKGLTPMEP